MNMRLEIGNPSHIELVQRLRRNQMILDLRAVLGVRCPECDSKTEIMPRYDKDNDMLIWTCCAEIYCECDHCGDEHSRDCEGVLTTELPDEYRECFEGAEMHVERYEVDERQLSFG